jgi:hypothetical protein
VPREKEIGRSGAIALGVVVALTGVAVVGAAFLAKPEGFHSPRWVVACAGAAFLFFGGWTVALYASGYDPNRPRETLPSARIQLAVLVPALLFFAAPFHWVAFGPGPRAFSSSFSLPFLSVGGRAAELPGRVMFGIGSLLIDAILAAAVIRLVREIGDKISIPTPSDGPADSP